MQRILLLSFLFISLSSAAQHNAGNNGKVLMIASNPSVSQQTGWPIGVWFAELAHPYWVFSEAGYTVDIASPDGGALIFDSFSDPEDASAYAAFDYISLGFKKDPAKMAMVQQTLKLSSVNPDDYKAIFVCGGQGPMYTFFNNQPLHEFFTRFYLTGKPTAAICHGTCILLKAKLPNGKFLVEGKKWTGFSSSEEQYADNYVGRAIQPFRIEDEARKMPNSRYVTGAPFSAFAVRDGNLITGQQQNSGAAAAELIVKALAQDRSRYPTYVLVHGAWADESAWGAIRNQLAVRANVEVVNLPAHGIDLRDGRKTGLADYVKTVTETINRQPGKVILVGHSMAGMIISQVADRLPQKIDKLVYVSAYLPRNGESAAGITNAFLNNQPIEAFQFNEDYSLVSIKKEMLPTVVCADCPDEMKQILVKYHKAEPVNGLNDKVVLGTNFTKVPKYYISTTEDYAVPYALQQQMIRKNGTVKKAYEMKTSHLPFVVQPQEFLRILTTLK
ncbi:MAG: alpha/beta fold hydrolase [Chitinophagales bacterium]|nr:alpha/beta fold hydrolase [Chitinophagales bacterium]